ncbi:MAG: hypothetical protein ACREQA_16535 [Candidatus Binatia bacterium]
MFATDIHHTSLRTNGWRVEGLSMNGVVNDFNTGSVRPELVEG